MGIKATLHPRHELFPPSRAAVYALDQTGTGLWTLQPYLIAYDLKGCPLIQEPSDLTCRVVLIRSLRGIFEFRVSRGSE